MAKLQKILIDSTRMMQARQALGLTQAQAAEKLEVSKRTIQRIEDTDTITRLKFSEIGKLSSIYKRSPTSLIAELPFEIIVYGIPVKSAEDFEGAFTASLTSELQVRHKPDDPEIEDTLLSLSSLHLEERKRTSTNRSEHEKLQHTFTLRKIFRFLTSEHRRDAVSIFLIPKFRVTPPHYDHPDDSYNWSAHWVMRLLAQNTKEAPALKYAVSTEYSYIEDDGSESHCLWINDDEFAEAALKARLPIEVPAKDTSENDDFSELEDEVFVEEVEEFNTAQAEDMAADIDDDY